MNNYHSKKNCTKILYNILCSSKKNCLKYIHQFYNQYDNFSKYCFNLSLFLNYNLFQIILNINFDNFKPLLTGQEELQMLP